MAPFWIILINYDKIVNMIWRTEYEFKNIDSMFLKTCRANF